MTIWLTRNLGVAPCDIEMAKDLRKLDVRDLVDRKGNNPRILREKIETGAGMLKKGMKVVVCCDLGISRSVAISIGILSLLGKPFDESVLLAVRKAHDQGISLDLLEDVRKAVCSGSGSRVRKKKRATNVLIVGSEGPVERAIVKRLSRKYVLHFSKTDETHLAKNALSLHSMVRDRKIDSIVDIAHAEPRNTVGLMLQSVAATRNVLEVCRLNNLPLVFLSTLLVFEGCDNKSVPALLSDLELRPVSLYAQGRGLCERLIEWYRRLYGLSITTLRLPYLYAEEMDKMTFLWKLLRKASEDKPIIVHKYLTGFQILDFLHLDDIAEAVEKAIRFHPSEDINLGSSTGISTLDLAKLVVKLKGSKSKVTVVNVKDFARNMVADPVKAKESLHWTSRAVFENGFKEIVSAQTKGED